MLSFLSDSIVVKVHKPVGDGDYLLYTVYDINANMQNVQTDTPHKLPALGSQATDVLLCCKHAVASRVNVLSTSLQLAEGVGFGTGTEDVRQKRENIDYPQFWR